MIWNIFILVAGLALILVGANALTDGAASVAKRFKISDLVIGLTIVAFGTSAPELVISLLSSIQGSAEMAIGNVVGSNITGGTRHNEQRDTSGYSFFVCTCLHG